MITGIFVQYLCICVPRIYSDFLSYTTSTFTWIFHSFVQTSCQVLLAAPDKLEAPESEVPVDSQVLLVPWGLVVCLGMLGPLVNQEAQDLRDLSAVLESEVPLVNEESVVELVLLGKQDQLEEQVP